MLGFGWVLRRRRYETRYYGRRVLGHKEIFCQSKHLVLTFSETFSEATQIFLSNFWDHGVSFFNLSGAVDNRHRNIRNHRNCVR